MPEMASGKTLVFKMKSQFLFPFLARRRKTDCCFSVKSKIRENLPFDTSVDIIHISAAVRRSRLFGTWLTSGMRGGENTDRNANILFFCYTGENT